MTDVERDLAVESEFYRIAAELDCWRFGDQETRVQFSTRLLERIQLARDELGRFERDVRRARELFSVRH